jgi:outer membrane protein assembly factor BamB
LSANTYPSSWTAVFYPEDDDKGVPSTGAITAIEGLAAGATREVFVGITPQIGTIIGSVNTTEVKITSINDPSKTGVSTLETAIGVWTTFHHDPQHTGRSPFKGPAHGVLKWSYTTGDMINCSSPVIGSDGTVYVGSSDKNLYAISSAGTLEWSYITGADIRSSPAIGPDGTVYVGSMDYKLYAFNPDTGDNKWSYTAGGRLWSSPVIGQDGTIYEGSFDDSTLYAFNPDGTFKWSYAVQGRIGWSNSAIGPDGTVYVGTVDDGYFDAINPDGTLKWSYYVGVLIGSSPTIGQDGTVYVGSADNNVYAIKPDGTNKWSYGTSGPVYSSPAIGPDGTVYVGSEDNNLYAINPDTGVAKWICPVTLTGGIDCSPAIDRDGTIYIGGNDNSIYAISSAGTIKWSYATGGVINSTPAIGSDGTLYVGSLDGKLYAFTEDTTPPVVTIEAPAIGAVISGETQYAISWEASDNVTLSPEAFTLWYTTDGGSNWSPVTTEVLVSQETTYLWNVPNVATNNAMISIEAMDWADNTGHGISDIFTMTAIPKIYLKAGLNLFSLYVIPEDTSINSVIGNKLEGLSPVIYSYSPTGWSVAFMQAGTWEGSLKTIEADKGYWIKVSSARTIEVLGSASMTDRIIHLKGTKANLVGSTYGTSRTMAETGLGTYLTPSDKVWCYFNNAWTVAYYDGSWHGSLNSLEPGRGYWVIKNSEGDVDWIYPKP